MRVGPLLSPGGGGTTVVVVVGAAVVVGAGTVDDDVLVGWTTLVVTGTVVFGVLPTVVDTGTVVGAEVGVDRTVVGVVGGALTVVGGNNVVVGMTTGGTVDVVVEKVRWWAAELKPSLACSSQVSLLQSTVGSDRGSMRTATK